MKVKSLLMHREGFNSGERTGFESCSSGSGSGIWQQLGWGAGKWTPMLRFREERGRAFAEGKGGRRGG